VDNIPVDIQNTAMKEIPAAQIRLHRLAMLDGVDPEGIRITKHGKPVAMPMPTKTKSARLIGSMRNRITIKGEILRTNLKWDAELAKTRQSRATRRFGGQKS
jgi:antitoxin (DNA-binding transcriptional repressor) of toxin-antitoxin stability system